MRPFLTILLLLSFALPAAAQPAQETSARAEPSAETVHEIPFGSTGNQITLTVANTAESDLKKVRVEIAETPAWLAFENPERTLDLVEARAETNLHFRFDARKGAPVSQVGTLRFTVASKSGRTWTRTVRVQAAPPESFALAGSYPNPFRGRATIAYDLPEAARVRVAVYDALGRRVKVLADEQQEVGRQTVRFDAGSLSSGVYFYRVEAGERAETGRMVLVR